MGQEQSIPPSGPQRSTQNIPYTNYSVEKSNPKDKTSRERSGLKEIYVVSAGQPQTGLSVKDEDEDLQKLQSLQYCKPVLHVPVQAETPKEFESLERFDLVPMLKLCTRYEDHLRQCAEAVTFDQDMLSSRIKEVDVNCASVMSAVSDRYRRLVHVAAHLRKVNELSLTLKRIDANIKRIVPTMDRLNNLLPEEDRLEAFTFQPAFDIQTVSALHEKL
ncbi:BLOC-1-related complex subunit 5-like [Actinia tenebrosa]|uniref:BLOC-1-related complex subunit 5 n=1 Tax=Actinia tenebrosa TaxID=6105 RepID=A0A6P8HJ66_ACTTE|nr:BLOC-1-related complex subunit 5-like [Actinia tenebrosa]